MKTFLADPAIASGNLVAVLCHRAERQPKRIAYTFLQDGETQGSDLTYEELDRKARMIAGQLQRYSAAGERALLLYPPGTEYISAFLGCLYAGVIAVPIYPPRLKRATPRLQAIVKDSQAKYAFTTSQMFDRLVSRLDYTPELAALQWVKTDDLSEGLAETWTYSSIDPATIAFLQYTSGSTATPKGVMVTHGNLWHNQKMIQAAFNHEPNFTSVSWLPAYHDMGLIGNILHPLYLGSYCVLMSPLAFLQRPLSWLEAISHYKAHTSGGPNFAYELCLNKIPLAALDSLEEPLDLSSWQIAFNGAEPVRASTLKRFSTRFEPYGFRLESFYPCYGLAEATLIVTGGQKSAQPIVRSFQADALEQNQVVPVASPLTEDNVRQLVGSGQSLLQQEILIVDPVSHTPCLPDQVGEIWVAGASVAPGYWNQKEKEETARTFQAYLAGTKERPFMRTGDLGFLQNGELFVTGRLKELIIIRGRNHYPQDIELTAEKSHALLLSGSGAAFSVTVAGEEQLVVVQEVDRHFHKYDLQEVAGAIRQAIAEEHGLLTYAVVLVKPRRIPRTSSGKIQRHVCHSRFLEDNLDAIEISILESDKTKTDVGEKSTSQYPTLDTLWQLTFEQRHQVIRVCLQQKLAALLNINVEQIDVNQPVSRWGLDSLMAVELQHWLESDFGIVLPMVNFLEANNIAQLTTKVLDQFSYNDASHLTTLTPSQEKATSSLSYGQQGIWFLHQSIPDKAIYNIAVAVRICGNLEILRLKKAFQQIVDRHDALRTAFSAPHNQPIQIIYKYRQVPFQVEDASAWPEEQIQAYLEASANQPFDLEKDILLRVGLLARSSQEHILLLVVHHIIADFWSLAILVEELGVLYHADQDDLTTVLPPLTVQYSDFITWQQEVLSGASGEQSLAYWSKRLAEDLPLLNLPTDRPRPAEQSFNGAAVFYEIPGPLTQELKSLSHHNETTLSMTLLTAFQVLLSRYSGQEDILVGLATSGRNRAVFNSLIGYFVNPITTRADFSDQPSFVQLLVQVRQSTLSAFNYQDYPFALLTKQLRPERDANLLPVFQVMFIWQQAPNDQDAKLNSFTLGKTGVQLEMGGLALELIPLPKQTAQFDIVVQMGMLTDGLGITIDYNTDLFDATTIQRMFGHFQTLLKSIVANPKQRVTELPLLTVSERAQLISAWNNTEMEYAQAACIHTLFERQVERQPNAIAVTYEEASLTYAELNRRANSLAHYLRGRGVGPDVLVGLYMPQSVEMIIGILAILKAGGAYVPLDPIYPQKRLQFMLADTGISILVTQQDMEIGLPTEGVQRICLGLEWEMISKESPHNPAHNVVGQNLAYIIYTSGSTGQPKGVFICHDNLVHSTMARLAAYDDPVSSYLLLSSFAFDSSIAGIFWTLSQGGRLVLTPTQVQQNILALSSVIKNQAITHTLLVPSLYRALLMEASLAELKHLRCVIVAGDICPVDLVNYHLDYLPDTFLYNEYGPTEGTVWSSVYNCNNGKMRNQVPIGRPIPNVQLYILDPFLQPVPIGVTGELFIGGRGVGGGYLNRAAVTAERFVPDPFTKKRGSRLYRTGDLARYLLDGNIEFLGRHDNQIKLHGFRIELDEIEAVLSQHPHVRDNLVRVRTTGTGGKQIMAYVVPTFQDKKIHEDISAHYITEFKTLYDEFYNHEELYSSVDAQINLQVWTSSYTHQPLPEEEILESVESTTQRILALQPDSVLEIGCGTGLLLSRIAPSCSYYCGTDISSVVLQRLRQHVHQSHRFQGKVDLWQREAADFQGVEEGSFDCVVLNEVVQHFPDVDYLVRVLEGAVRCVRSGGSVFLGGIFNLKLSEYFHTSLQLQKASVGITVSQMRQRINSQMVKHKDLFLDPIFFVALKNHLPQISHVQIELKGGASSNEITKFKYDVTLFIGSEHLGTTVKGIAENPIWLDWSTEALSLPSIQRLLAENAPEFLGIRDVPNGRLVTEAHMVQTLKSIQNKPDSTNLQQVFNESMGQLAAIKEAVDPEAVWALRHKLPYHIEICWAASGRAECFDVMCYRHPMTETITTAIAVPIRPDVAAPSRPWAYYGNKEVSKILQHPLLEAELQTFLRKRVPAFMVPTTVVIVSALPLTINGKVDESALPDPSKLALTTEMGYVAPRNDLEKTIASIWQNVLNLEKVGINDNFFDLGGDSIISIQIVSQLEREGWKITPQKIFQYQTVAELAAVVIPTKDTLPQMDIFIEEETSLTPIQKWFFEQEWRDFNDFCQAITLRSDTPLDVGILKIVFQTLIDRHDALRMRYVKKGPDWQQKVLKQGEEVAMEIIDLTSVPSTKLETALEVAQNRLLTSIDITHGPIFKVGIFQLEKDVTILFLVCHHLVIDGVSWRIIVADIVANYMLASQNNSLNATTKPPPFLYWAKRLSEYAHSESVIRTVDYWRAAGQKNSFNFPVRIDQNSADKVATTTVNIPANITKALLADANRAYRTTINDLLLTALTRALCTLTSQTTISLTLEGHGRDGLEEDGLFASTVGWFTTSFPVVFEMNQFIEIGQQIKYIKESLRHIPAKGLGFGILKYLSSGEEIQKIFSTYHQPVILFNYLGQVNKDLGDLFQIVALTGKPVPELPHNEDIIEVTGMVFQEELRFDLNFNGRWYDTATIEKLASLFKEELEAVVVHCSSPNNKGFTPSDFSLLQVNQHELDHWEQSFPQLSGKHVLDMYPLSPMQQGMLLHALIAPDSFVSFEQFSFLLEGALHRKFFEKAWEYLGTQHDVLRTVFDWQTFSQPVQIVVKENLSAVHWEDLSHLPEDIQAQKLKQFQTVDRHHPFNLASGPLIRISVFKLGAQSFSCLLSLHHIISDGWSFPMLLESLFQIYQSFCQNTQFTAAKNRPYKEYIKWLNQQDAQKAQEFWLAMLHDFKVPTPLPVDFETNVSAVQDTAEKALSLNGEQAEALVNFAHLQRVTLNTLIQAAWAILLWLHSNQPDVVFGTVVSGRPTDIQGIEKMLGLFINNLPMRVQFKDSVKVGGFLTNLQTASLSIRDYEHSYLPHVQACSAVPATKKLFNTLIVFQNYPLNENVLSLVSDLKLKGVTVSETASYDLTLTIFAANQLQLRLQYHPQKFSEIRINQLLQHIEIILTYLARFPEMPLRDFEDVLRQALGLSKPLENNTIEATVDKPLSINHRAQTDLERHVARIWQDVLELVEVDIEEPFFNLTPNSLTIATVHLRLQEALARPFPIVKMFEYPTIKELAAYLSQPQREPIQHIRAMERAQKAKAAINKRRSRIKHKGEK